MLEDIGGNVTNLCRQRAPVRIRRGIITETGPYIPVTLGFSMDSSNEGWEEVYDEAGNPTGIERMSFRLNVENGLTESIDEELNEVRRINGLFDGTNNVRDPTPSDISYYVNSSSEPEPSPDSSERVLLCEGYEGDISDEGSGTVSTVAAVRQGLLADHGLGGTRDIMRASIRGVGDTVEWCEPVTRSDLGGTRDTLTPNMGVVGSMWNPGGTEGEHLINSAGSQRSFEHSGPRFADDRVTVNERSVFEMG